MELNHLEWILMGLGGMAGMGSGAAAAWLLGRLPAAWLLDYHESANPGADACTDQGAGTDQSPAPAWALPPWAIPSHVILMGLTGSVSMFWVVTGQQGTAQGIWMFLLLWILSFLSLADLTCRILPDQLALSLGGLGLLNLWISSDSAFLTSSLVGALLGGGILLVLGVLGGVWIRQETMGFGDVKLMAALGFCLGPHNILAVLTFTLLFLGTVAAALLVLKRITTKGSLPLAPFAFAATLIFYCDSLLPHV